MSAPGFVGVVAAMPLEARGLVGLGAGLKLEISGPGPARAAAAASRLVSLGATGLVSWGCAGGLQGDVPAGALLFPEWLVSTDGRRFEPDRRWRGLMAGAWVGMPCAAGGLAESAEPVLDVAAKRQLAESTGALATDMESAAIAAVAGRAGIPLLVVRSIVDPAGVSVPVAALQGLGSDGRMRRFATLAAVLHRPAELPALIATALRFRQAIQSLDAAAARLPLPVGAAR